MAVVVEDELAGVEAGRAGHFGLVVGVDHHDDADDHGYADELRAHGADVVVADLGELLNRAATSRMGGTMTTTKEAYRMDHMDLSHHHLATAAKILAHPVSHNIAWHDVVSMIGQLGTITEGPNHRFTVIVGTGTETFDSPRGGDLETQQVVDLRRMLHNAGITPESLKL